MRSCDLVFQLSQDKIFSCLRQITKLYKKCYLSKAKWIESHPDKDIHKYIKWNKIKNRILFGSKVTRTVRRNKESLLYCLNYIGFHYSGGSWHRGLVIWRFSCIRVHDIGCWLYGEFVIWGSRYFTVSSYRGLATPRFYGECVIWGARRIET